MAPILFKSILFLKECRLPIADYRVEALSRKKGCVSAVQTCKQASVRNSILGNSVSFVALPEFSSIFDT